MDGIVINHKGIIMKNIFTITVAAVICVVFSSCGYALQDASVGKYTYVEGRVDALKDPEEGAARIKEQELIQAGDIIRTKTSSRAEITFRDGTVIRLAPNSRIGIKEYALNDNGEREKALIELYRGKIRSIVSKNGDRQNFHIITPSARGTVRGTDIFAIYQADTTSMLVKHGKMAVAGLDDTDQMVELMKGEALSVPVDSGATSKRIFLDAELEQHIKDTAPTFKPDPNMDKEGIVKMKGKVLRMKGEVYAIKAGEEKPGKVEPGEIFGEGDQIKTGPDGMAEIILENGNIIEMQPGSDLTIKRMRYNPKTKEYENLFKSDYGKIKAVIEKVGEKSTFKVKTPSAVCGARGTVMYLNITSVDTTAFFEGGAGDITSLISGDNAIIDAGQNSTADSMGNVSMPVDTTGGQMMKLDEMFDGAEGIEGYTDPEKGMSHGDVMGFSEGGHIGDKPGFMDVADKGPGDGTFSDSDIKDIMDIWVRIQEASGVEVVTEVTHFKGVFGDVEVSGGNPDFDKTRNTSSDNFIEGKMVLGIPNPTGIWGEGLPVTIGTSQNGGNSLTGTYARDPAVHDFWNSEVVDIRPASGGVILGAIGGGIAPEKAPGDNFYKMGGKFLGLYIDGTGYGGTISGIYGGKAHENTFETDLMFIHYSPRALVTSITADELTIGIVEDAITPIRKGDPAVNNIYGQFNDGSPVPGSITGSVSGDGIQIPGEQWGIWWVHAYGNFVPTEAANTWTMTLNGRVGPDSMRNYYFGTIKGIAAGGERPDDMNWEGGMLMGKMKGVWFDIDEDTGTLVSGGYIFNGDMAGSYSAADGNWQASGGGEWVTLTHKLDPVHMGFANEAALNAHLNNFVNVPITEVHSAMMNNITGGTAQNSITNPQVNTHFYAMVNNPSTTLWGGTIFANHDGSLTPGWTLAVNNAQGQEMTLQNQTWAGNEWTATVSGDVTPANGNTGTFTGQMAGTYSDTQLQGVGGGQWDNTN